MFKVLDLVCDVQGVRKQLYLHLLYLSQASVQLVSRLLDDCFPILYFLQLGKLSIFFVFLHQVDLKSLCQLSNFMSETIACLYDLKESDIFIFSFRYFIRSGIKRRYLYRRQPNKLWWLSIKNLARWWSIRITPVFLDKVWLTVALWCLNNIWNNLSLILISNLQHSALGRFALQGITFQLRQLDLLILEYNIIHFNSLGHSGSGIHCI